MDIAIYIQINFRTRNFNFYCLFLFLKKKSCVENCKEYNHRHSYSEYNNYTVT